MWSSNPDWFFTDGFHTTLHWLFHYMAVILHGLILCPFQWFVKGGEYLRSPPYAACGCWCQKLIKNPHHSVSFQLICDTLILLFQSWLVCLISERRSLWQPKQSVCPSSSRYRAARLMSSFFSRSDAVWKQRKHRKCLMFQSQPDAADVSECYCSK